MPADFLRHSPLDTLRQGLSLNPELPALGIPRLSLVHAGPSHPLGFLMWVPGIKTPALTCSAHSTHSTMSVAPVFLDFSSVSYCILLTGLEVVVILLLLAPECWQDSFVFHHVWLAVY